MEYLSILLFFFSVTVFLEHKYRIHLYHNRAERLLIIGFFFVISVIWDSYATWRGHWAYPKDGNLGIVIGVLPIEEYLFALIVPYFILTIYKVVDANYSNPLIKLWEKLKIN